MKYLSLIIITLAFVVVHAIGCNATTYDVKTVLEQLDEAVSNRDYYYGRRALSLDSIKRLLPDTTIEQRLSRYERIGDEYSLFDNDSVLVYYTRGLNTAVDCGCDSMVTVFSLKLAAHLPIAGFVTLASNYYEAVDTMGMSDPMKFLYYDSGRKMNYFIGVIYGSLSGQHEYWMTRVEDCQRNMIEYLDRNSDMYLKNLGDYYFVTHQQGKAWDTLVKLLERDSIDSYVYANTAEILSRIAAERGDIEAQKYYLALAARTDIYSAAREVSALQQLAALLFKENDVYRAYEYMSAALNNATECNAVARIRQISPQLPLITKSHEKLMNWWTVAYAIIIAVLGTCIVIIIVITYFLCRHIKSMKCLHSGLLEANKAKEVYISQFMVLCSVYMDKLNQFNNLVNRKLGAGQTDELYKLTKTGKLIEEQTRDFYNVFDDAFLHIYPTFVNEVNNLLLPEERIVLKDGERLNTDLRILACLRLGLDDANRIAQILNYSVNTIYSYRNRLRNRAISRDTFELDLMQIGYS